MEKVKKILLLVLLSVVFYTPSFASASTCYQATGFAKAGVDGLYTYAGYQHNGEDVSTNGTYLIYKFSYAGIGTYTDLYATIIPDDTPNFAYYAVNGSFNPTGTWVNNDGGASGSAGTISVASCGATPTPTPTRTPFPEVGGAVAPQIGAELGTGLLKVLLLLASLISFGILMRYLFKWIGRRSGPDPMTSSNHQIKRFNKIRRKMKF